MRLTSEIKAEIDVYVATKLSELVDEKLAKERKYIDEAKDRARRRFTIGVMSILGLNAVVFFAAFASGWAYVSSKVDELVRARINTAVDTQGFSLLLDRARGIHDLLDSAVRKVAEVETEHRRVLEDAKSLETDLASVRNIASKVSRHDIARVTTLLEAIDSNPTSSEFIVTLRDLQSQMENANAILSGKRPATSIVSERFGLIDKNGTPRGEFSVRNKDTQLLLLDSHQKTRVQLTAMAEAACGLLLQDDQEKQRLALEYDPGGTNSTSFALLQIAGSDGKPRAIFAGGDEGGEARLRGPTGDELVSLGANQSGLGRVMVEDSTGAWSALTHVGLLAGPERDKTQLNVMLLDGNPRIRLANKAEDRVMLMLQDEKEGGTIAFVEDGNVRVQLTDTDLLSGLSIHGRQSESVGVFGLNRDGEGVSLGCWKNGTPRFVIGTADSETYQLILCDKSGAPKYVRPW